MSNFNQIWSFSTYFLKSPQHQVSWIIRPVSAAIRRTVKHDESKRHFSLFKIKRPLGRTYSNASHGPRIHDPNVRALHDWAIQYAFAVTDFLFLNESCWNLRFYWLKTSNFSRASKPEMSVSINIMHYIMFSFG